VIYVLVGLSGLALLPTLAKWAMGPTESR
jgi:uncharacterized membrane protein YuzA (DUF378 family)